MDFLNDFIDSLYSLFIPFNIYFSRNFKNRIHFKNLRNEIDLNFQEIFKTHSGYKLLNNIYQKTSTSYKNKFEMLSESMKILSLISIFIIKKYILSDNVDDIKISESFQKIRTLHFKIEIMMN